MTDHEVGYLQALKDMQASVRHTVDDPGTTTDGKVELLGVVSHLADLILRLEPRGEAPSDQDAPDPIGGSF